MFGSSLVLILGVISLRSVECQTVRGCPSYGCRPSGTFSFSIDLPASPEYAWKTNFEQDALPTTLGCVGNDVYAVCQSNATTYKGYVCFNPSNGQAVWRDTILKHPVLPIMDIYGDVIGSDGRKLIMYNNDGKVVKPVIPLGNDIFPIYSLGFSDNNVIFIVSKNGLVFSYESNGVPHASIQLKGTVERANGTFIPVATPVLAGSRAYILTEFRPDYEEDASPEILGMQRLYAVDIYQRMVDRLDTVWYYNFEREYRVPIENGQFPIPTEENFINTASKPRVMVNSVTNTVYAYVPPPMSNGLGHEQGTPFLWAFKDPVGGNNPELLFKVPVAVSAMTTFEPNPMRTIDVKRTEPTIERETGNDNKWKTPVFHTKKNSNSVNSAESPLWVLRSNKEQIVKISPLNGTVEKTLNLSSILGNDAVVTSELMSTRTSDGKESLIFGVKITKPPANFQTVLSELSYIPKNVPTNATSFVISISDGNLNWAIAVPENLEVRGQIAGIQNTQARGRDDDARDVLVAFATDDKSSLIFAIN